MITEEARLGYAGQMKNWIVSLNLIGKRIGKQMTVRHLKVRAKTDREARIAALLKFSAKHGNAEADRWAVCDSYYIA